MADLGDMIARLLLDSSQWVQGMAEAEEKTAEAATGIEASLAGMSEGLGKIGAALGELAIAEGIKKIAESAIEASDQFAKFQTAVTNFTGDAAGAKQLLEDVQGIAKTSPFEFPELAGAAQRMVQLGMSTEQAKTSLTAIAEMGTALKLTGEQVTGVANAMARLDAGAQPMRVMNQLVAEGIPAWKILAEQMGPSMADAQAAVKNHLVDAQTVVADLTA